MISTLKRLQAKRADQENNGGFTLIELLIVIVVLGILAAVVVFSLGGVAGTSAIAACQSDGSSINTAIQAWTAQTGNVATTVTQADLTPSYLQTWPANLGHYTYAISSDGVIEVHASSGTATPAPTTLTAAGYATGGWTAWVGPGTCGTANVK